MIFWTREKLLTRGQIQLTSLVCAKEIAMMIAIVAKDWFVFREMRTKLFPDAREILSGGGITVSRLVYF